MLNIEIAPALSGLLLLAASALVGAMPIKKLIQVQEAKHELKQGSAGFLRTIKGWSVIAFWLAGTWYLATILGDWAANRDLAGAIDRAVLRLWVLMEILQTIAEFDT